MGCNNKLTDLHQQKAKLVAKNGADTPMLLHILPKSSEQLFCNLLPCFEAFNDVIMSSQHFNNLFSHLSKFTALVSFRLVV